MKKNFIQNGFIILNLGLSLIIISLCSLNFSQKVDRIFNPILNIQTLNVNANENNEYTIKEGYEFNYIKCNNEILEIDEYKIYNSGKMIGMKNGIIIKNDYYCTLSQ